MIKESIILIFNFYNDYRKFLIFQILDSITTFIGVGIFKLTEINPIYYYFNYINIYLLFYILFFEKIFLAILLSYAIKNSILFKTTFFYFTPIMTFISCTVVITNILTLIKVIF